MSEKQRSSRIKALVKSRLMLKGKLVALKKFVDEYDENPDVYQLSLRNNKFSEDIEAFESVQTDIENLVETIEPEIAVRTEFENDFFAYKSKIERLLNQNSPETNAASGRESHLTSTREPVPQPSSRNAGTNLPQFFINVPKLELPKFGGSYEDWPGFADAFKAAVHSDDRFKNSQKLIYLRSCLTGKAANKIESLETTDANYLVAWNQLEKYYDDPNACINKRVKAIFDLPNCTRPTASGIGEILDNARKHYRALEVLNRPFLEAFPICAIISKLDQETCVKWKERIHDINSPTMEMLLEFLHSRQKILEGAKNEKIERVAMPLNISNRPSHGSDTRKNNTRHSYASQTTAYCHICKGSHFTQTCEKLTNANVTDRLALIEKLKLCRNCLRANHLVKDCKSTHCKKCNNKHHTLLHNDTLAQQAKVACLTANSPAQVILSTALIDVIDKDGQPNACRVLLDSCSQSNFMTEQFASKIGLKRDEINIPVNGINNTIHYYKQSLKAEMQSRVNRFSQNLTFLILPNLPGTLPSQHIDKGRLTIPLNVRLADPFFNKPGEIDALLGAEIFYNLLCVGQIKLSKDGAVLQKTQLGWIIGGKVAADSPHESSICKLSTEALNMQMAKFWEIEEGPQGKHLSVEESACEKHFIENTTRDPSSGRYTVRLPFKESRVKLGESYSNALRRFFALEKSLNRNRENRQQYVDFMREYEALGHMTEVDVAKPATTGYYLPHHAVFKRSSLTTKLRVVFDASAKTTTRISLNDALMVGPVIQEDLFSIVLRFRTHQYVLTADAEKMYRQILMHEADRDFQKILWRDHENETIKTFTLNTVTYGTASASFLATRTLKQLSIDEEGSFLQAARVLASDFYVDDLLTGAETKQDAQKLRDDLINLTRRGGFNLRQWASNEPGLIDDLSKNSNESFVNLNIDETVKTLGLYWNAKQDCITYTINTEDPNKRITKREILSQIARLFDPLGLLGPVIIKAKILMQGLWQLRIDWDETIPLAIFTAWQSFAQQLPALHEARIERRVIIENYTNIQLHCFGDASERAYGACLYIRSSNKDGRVLTRLLCAKSRVAPLKTVTLPRLELCAAALVVQLFKTVKASLHNIKFDETIFWSDSTVALQWINTSPHVLKTFVSNRVAAIQSHTEPAQWRHVPSEENPADLLSRGLAPHEFLNNNLWPNGPDWLGHNECEWPTFELELAETPESKPSIAYRATQVDNEMFENFSSFNRMKRVLAYCFRFIAGCQKRKNHDKDTTIPADFLHAAELRAATNFIIKRIQLQAFSKEIHSLSNSKQIEGNLRPLNPFLDSEGILRVGGRLALAKHLNSNQKHQALIPKNHHVTKLIIRDEHTKNFHAGTQATLNAIRQNYWITNAHSNIRKVIHECIRCHKARPASTTYPMGNLPAHRVEYERPFLHAGVDYCGPFFIKERHTRNRSRRKIYVAIFVCFATRAVHMEIVFDLTTGAFLAALSRFFARRGKSSHIYSDNATNFVGAKNSLNELYQFFNTTAHLTSIKTSLANDGIQWNFIPPRSPHFGGLWEAAVKSFKFHLVRVIGETLLSVESFLTCITEIEAILNSRPITPITADPNDLNALTPGHFLIGERLTNIPEHDITSIPSARLSNWQRVRQIRQHFWKRWYKEYLHGLTVRKRWHTGTTTNIAVGSLVIVKEDNIPPMQWRLARIIATHPGEDGIVRVATVKTSTGEYKRCIKRLAPLPLDSN